MNTNTQPNSGWLSLKTVKRCPQLQKPYTISQIKPERDLQHTLLPAEQK